VKDSQQVRIVKSFIGGSWPLYMYYKIIIKEEGLVGVEEILVTNNLIDYVDWPEGNGEALG
jgi:hypothetical protein